MNFAGFISVHLSIPSMLCYVSGFMVQRSVEVDMVHNPWLDFISVYWFPSYPDFVLIPISSNFSTFSIVEIVWLVVILRDCSRDYHSVSTSTINNTYLCWYGNRFTQPVIIGNVRQTPVSLRVLVVPCMVGRSAT